jgi:hypothetical protein
VTTTGIKAQVLQTVTVKAGYKINEVLSLADIFYYPQFKKGRVAFRDGSKAEAKLNFNCFTGEMQFINPSGDTLALADEKDTRYIAIESDTFYYDDGYVRLTQNTPVVKLAAREMWMMADVKKVGAFDIPTKNTGIESLKTITQNEKSYELAIKEDILLKKVEQYYLGDRYNHFVRATKKNVLQLFPKQEKRIQQYLKENDINFTRKEDLLKLIGFISLVDE